MGGSLSTQRESTFLCERPHTLLHTTAVNQGIELRSQRWEASALIVHYATGGHFDIMRGSLWSKHIKSIIKPFRLYWIWSHSSHKWSPHNAQEMIPYSLNKIHIYLSKLMITAIYIRPLYIENYLFNAIIMLFVNDHLKQYKQVIILKLASIHTISVAYTTWQYQYWYWSWLVTL